VAKSFSASLRQTQVFMLLFALASGQMAPPLDRQTPLPMEAMREACTAVVMASSTQVRSAILEI
jgi:hypothetical protein